jgi:hypothetical protein
VNLVMSQVTLDAISIATLQSIVVPTKVCDASGKVMGTYIPLAAQDDEESGQLRPPLSTAEYQQRLEEPARPLTEIWKSLGGP